MIKDALFYSKILLFGEYGIIQDSMGLSIPYKAFRGELKFKEDCCEKSDESNHHLNKYYAYLVDLNKQGLLKAKLDLEAFHKDITSGMYFDSTIPQGFGVGSSGALVAAIYDKYAINPVDDDPANSKDLIVSLKDTFAQLESYFHGKSSGIDPLICYLKLPILIKSKSDLGTVGLPEEGAGKGAIFLLDSGSPGRNTTHGKYISWKR